MASTAFDVLSQTTQRRESLHRGLLFVAADSRQDADGTMKQFRIVDGRCKMVLERSSAAKSSPFRGISGQRMPATGNRDGSSELIRPDPTERTPDPCAAAFSRLLGGEGEAALLVTGLRIVCPVVSWLVTEIDLTVK